MKPFLFILFVIVVLTACEHTRSDTPHYYALDSLINAQTTQLAQAKAILSKEAFIDGEVEQKTFIPDTTQWKFEFEVFAGLNDINKPTLQGKYKIERGVKDVNSNLLIYSITSTENLPVDHLNIYYLNNLSDIRKIEGLFREENALQKGSRKMSMEFQNINNKIVLTSYSLQGGQKMILGDSVTFSVHGTITLP